jgi:hypothetical protein
MVERSHHTLGDASRSSSSEIEGYRSVALRLDLDVQSRHLSQFGRFVEVRRDVDKLRRIRFVQG